MPTISTFYARNRQRCRLTGFLFAVWLLHSAHAQAQVCPPNIDFETGTFVGWTCYTGYVSGINGQNIITLSASNPTPGQHSMYSANAGTDPYGGFPVNCPNGSGHSIRLGNDQGGGLAEGISYEFTIPANRNIYSLIYHYAVVFQDPSHQVFQQPRMEIEITNVTDNTIISCSSFSFFPVGSPLPGFFLSPVIADDAPVWCKDWSAVTINLNGMAGKTIRLFFKTADCTFRRHFGYAYIDVNSECSSEFVGATYCPDDTAVSVTAPYGYQNYTWFNSSFTQQLGNQQQIYFKPPPPAGTTIAVEVVPYNGYGCLDTFYALMLDTLTVKSQAGPDRVSCNQNPVPLGAPPKQGLVYSWSPATGLSDPNSANPMASPSVTTTYVLTTRNNGGGCIDFDTVVVQASLIDDSLQLIGNAAYCEGDDDSAILRVLPGYQVQWFRNDVAIAGASARDFRVQVSGTYCALLTNAVGCQAFTAKQQVLIDRPVPGIRYPLQYAVNRLPLTLQARPIGISAVWSPGNYLDNRNSYRPVFTSSEDYAYTIQMVTLSGCVTVDTLDVKIVPAVEIYVPTAFTPNKDGRNDRLRPVLMGIKELYFFRVYNRWGQLIHESRNENEGWDGRWKGTELTTQVVVWMAEGLGVDGKVHVRKGTSAVIR